MRRLFVIFAVLACVSIAFAGCKPKEKRIGAPRKDLKELVPPTELEAFDTPNDSGRSITLKWKASKTENTPYFLIGEEIERLIRLGSGTVAEKTRINREVKDTYRVEPRVFYHVMIAESENGPWIEAKKFTSDSYFASEKPDIFGRGKKWEGYHYYSIKKIPKKVMKKGGECVEPKPLVNGKKYFLRLKMTLGDKTIDVPGTAGVVPAGDVFDTGKISIFVVMIAFGVIVIFYIRRAKTDSNLFIRKISGLDAVDEAIGRATEMGKAIFYMTGLRTMADLPTIASINILSRVARRAAKYDTELKVPCYDPVVMTVAQEVVREAFQAEGRLDSFKEENVFFVTQDQFSYVAAVDGMMVRERPATNFLMGYFYAESLLLSETGASIGAIQIAGTDALSQLPFFITTTDYTLIGEELYAASAYLSRDPMLLGSLKGQDVGKAVLIVMIVLGTILATFGIDFIKQLFTAY